MRFCGSGRKPQLGARSGSTQPGAGHGSMIDSWSFHPGNLRSWLSSPATATSPSRQRIWDGEPGRTTPMPRGRMSIALYTGREAWSGTGSALLQSFRTGEASDTCCARGRRSLSKGWKDDKLAEARRVLTLAAVAGSVWLDPLPTAAEAPEHPPSTCDRGDRSGPHWITPNHDNVLAHPHAGAMR
jgi:hypothetical protein